MVQRLCYRRQNSYNTKSNKVITKRLPGGKLIFQHRKKAGGKPKCGDCKKPLQGVPAVRPEKLRRLTKNARRVSRVYGGSRCHKCVRDRIIRAFMLEEQKCVRAVLVEKEKQKTEATKKPTSVVKNTKSKKTTSKKQ